jgi:hypothetical protein
VVWKRRKTVVMKNNFVQNKRTYFLKSPQKLLEKVTNVATSREKPHEFKSNVFVNTSIV